MVFALAPALGINMLLCGEGGSVTFAKFAPSVWQLGGREFLPCLLVPAGGVGHELARGASIC